MVFNVSTDARDRIDSVPEDARRTGEFVTVFDHALFERTLESESDPLGDVLELEGEFDERLRTHGVFGADDDHVEVFDGHEPLVVRTAR